MKSIHFILFCFVGTMSVAQIRFNSAFNPCSIDESQIVKNADYYCHNRIINKVQEIQEIMWSKVDVSIPLGWQSYVCDNNNCYTPKIVDCPDKLPNVLLVDSTVNMDVHFETGGIQGGAHVVLWVFEKGDTTNRLKIDYLFNMVLSNHETKTISLKMYPNPTASVFSIATNTILTQVELYDILGQKVASYPTFESYDISHLKDGIYSVKIIGLNKQVIAILRIQKQGPRS